MANVTKVTIHSASNLRVTQVFGRQDPYCKVTAGRRSYKTRVADDAHTDATFNQTFEFPGAPRAFNFEVYNQNSLSDSLIGEVRGIRCNAGQRVHLELKSQKGKPSGTLTVTFEWQEQTVGGEGDAAGGASSQIPMAGAAVAVGDVGARLLRATMGGSSSSGQVTVSGREQSALRQRSNSNSGSAQFVTDNKAPGAVGAAAVVAPPVAGLSGDVPMFANPIAQAPSVPAVPQPPAPEAEADDGSAMFVTDHVKTVTPEVEERNRQRRAAREQAERAEQQRRAQEAAAAQAAAAQAAAEEAQRVARLQEQRRQEQAQAAAQRAEYERQRQAQQAAAAERQRQAQLAAQQQAEAQRQAQVAAQRQAQAAAQARAAPGMVLVEVQVPAGISPGQALQIRAPSGQLLQVTVPAGVYSGMKFKAQVPAAAPAPAMPAPVAVPRAGPGAYNQFQYPGAGMGGGMMRGLSMMGAGMPQPRISAAPVPQVVQPRQQQLMMVTVPAGVYPGQSLQLRTPAGQLVQVQVPQGCRPGSQFQVRV